MRTLNFALVLGGLLVAGCGSGGPDPDQQNAPPSLRSLGDQAIPANQSTQSMDFVIADDRTPAEGLIVSAMSGNPDLIPAGGIDLGGTGASRSLVISPTADETGIADVTVTVTDEADLQTSQTIAITVLPQSKGISEFTRMSFADGDAGDPALVNAVAFTQDADDDEFEDLLTP